jgi:hypothetical protein
LKPQGYDSCVTMCRPYSKSEIPGVVVKGFVWAA